MAYVLIVLAVVCRLLPHPWNFTPVLAMALFSGAVLPRRTAWIAPVAALVISDLALGSPFGWINLVVYGCFLSVVGLGHWFCADSHTETCQGRESQPSGAIHPRSLPLKGHDATQPTGVLLSIKGWLDPFRHRSWTRTLGTTLAGSLLFYLVTNFAVWLSPSFLYEHTPSGLLQCYVMALPFFRNSLAGDLFWSLTLFGLYDLAHAWVSSRGVQWQRAI